MKVKFLAPHTVSSGCVVVFADENARLLGHGLELDKALGGRLTTAIKTTGFIAKREAVLDIVGASSDFSHVLVVGLGSDSLNPLQLEYMGGAIAGALQSAKVKTASLIVDLPQSCHVKPDEAAALLAAGASLRTYRFDRYKTKKPDKGQILEELIISTASPVKAKKAYEALAAVVEGVVMARDLVNEPANILTPIAFAERIKELTKLGLEVEILAPAQLKKIGMGALLGVAQGSAHEPRVVIMKWNGSTKGQPPLAFVGKGVTFDTGGVSIKPAAGMEDMKGDMGGAAAVTGLMLALAKRKAKANVIGMVGLVENAVDGAAQRPGDVVTSLSGQTIAVLNTDAEGRLILADLLWYVQDKYKPRFMIDLATLTGAILVALGKEHAGLFSHTPELAEQIKLAGLETGEKVWQLPLADEYDKMIDSDIADMKNIGGRNAGSITAAQFLKRFVNKLPWAHLDIAGTAMDAPKTAISQSWASGWGVRLLNRLVADNYEK